MSFLNLSLATAVAKIAGITSSGLFAGYTLALSDAAVPAILPASEEMMVKQWRIQYLRGFLMAIPATITNLSSWILLAYTSRNNTSSLSRQLYTTAAVTTGSGTVFAWTALRYINGALAIRADKLAGPGNTSGKLALNYSRNEKWTRETEAKYSTAELVVMWMRYNQLRAIILVVGTIIGAYGLALEEH